MANDKMLHNAPGMSVIIVLPNDMCSSLLYHSPKELLYSKPTCPTHYCTLRIKNKGENFNRLVKGHEVSAAAGDTTRHQTAQVSINTDVRAGVRLSEATRC